MFKRLRVVWKLFVLIEELIVNWEDFYLFIRVLLFMSIIKYFFGFLVGCF